MLVPNRVRLDLGDALHAIQKCEVAPCTIMHQHDLCAHF